MLSLLSPKLFVSYSRRDHVFVKNLVRALRDRGFRVFIDSSDICCLGARKRVFNVGE